jgi:hypothetical protein
MPPGGSTCTATSNFFPITSSFNGQLVIGWTALSPGTTYYWRACYKTGNLTFWGSNQTLRTTGTPKPKLLSISRTFALPGQSVQINGSNLSGASIALVLGGSSTPATVTANTSESVTFTVPSLNSFVGYVQLTTAGGSVTSPPFQLGVDTIVDSTTVSDQDGNGQKDDVLIQFHVTEPFPFAEANCHLDTSPFMNSCRSGTVVYRDLAPGMHKVEITGYINHASGHWEDFSPAVANFVVTNADTTPPNTTLTTSPQQGSAVPATSVNLAYSSNEAGSKFECRYDGNWQLWSPCLSPQTWSGLSQGFHLFGVRAKDAANNVDPTPEYLTFTVDTVAPETILRSGPAAGSSTTSKTATFEVWSINGNGALQCSLDGGFVPNCRSPKTYTGLAPGTHTFRARAVDWAGNVDPTSATRTWTVLP